MTGTLVLIVAIVLRILSNPLANVYQKQLTSKGNHPLIVNFLTYFLLSLFCCFLLTVIDIPVLGRDFWIYSILGGIAGAVGNGFLVKALQLGDLSVLGPINAYKSVVGIIVGIFLLSEVPNLWGILGIGLIIYGSYFVLDTTEERFNWKLLRKPEIQFRIWAMILTAIEAVFIKRVILASTTTLAFISWCILAHSSHFRFVFLQNQDSNRVETCIQTAVHWEVLLLILCIGIMQFTTNYALGHMP